MDGGFRGIVIVAKTEKSLHGHRSTRQEEPTTTIFKKPQLIPRGSSHHESREFGKERDTFVG
jgi:hypothetical protein